MGKVFSCPSDIRRQLDDEIPQVQHPGNMEDLHKKTKDVFPHLFDGIKLQVNKALSNHFQVTHSINIESPLQSGYRFGTTYVGTTKNSSEEFYPLLVGDLDSTGNLNAVIVHQINNNIKLRYIGQFLNNKQSSSQFQMDYYGKQSSSSFAFANLDIFKKSGIAIMQHLQSVSRRVALGAVLATQMGPEMPGHAVATLALVARYSGDYMTTAATINTQARMFSLYFKETEQFGWGVELNSNNENGEFLVRAGYQYDIPETNFVFRGMVDTKWSIGAAFEKKLGELPFYLNVSSSYNHTKQNCKVGCGLVIR